MGATPAPTRRPSVPEAAGVSGLAVLWLAMMTGGTGPLDRAVLRALYSANHPAIERIALFLTWLGDWPVLLPLTLIAVAFLVARRHARAALLLLATTLLGRGLVEAQKYGIHRLRPDDIEQLVPVKTPSFPSAHAANSMIFFLSIALLAVPERHRKIAVAIALLTSFAVGLTRPMLGVHWPTDVIGGWSFGAAWVLTMLYLSRRLGSRRGSEGSAE